MLVPTMRNLIKEFKTFAIKGNAVDLAVGVVIGAAFSQITNSLVTNILMPPLGFVIGGINFSELVLPIGGHVTIQYGLFIQALVNFILIAFALFLFVKLINRLNREHAREVIPQAEKSAELKTLEEIRDELRKSPAKTREKKSHEILA